MNNSYKYEIYKIKSQELSNKIIDQADIVLKIALKEALMKYVILKERVMETEIATKKFAMNYISGKHAIKFLKKTKTFKRLSPEEEKDLISKRRKATEEEVEECFNRSEDPRAIHPFTY